MAIYSNEDLIKYYEDALLKRKNDIIRQYAEAEQMLRASKPNIEDAYAKARTNAYTTARLSAIGNNERLAAYGLAGNLYAQPRSGYSETSRIYQDVAMQNTINSLGEEQRKALQELEAAIRANQQNKLSALNTVESQYGEQIANLRQSALDKNFQLEKSQADTFASMASQGYELDDAQKALLAKYNYNYDAIRKHYLDAYNKSLVEEYKKLLAQGATLTDEQKAIMSKYGYDYQQLYDIYEREQTIGKQKQFAQTYLALLEGGASLTPEQARVFESVYGVPADQYKAFLTEQNQKKTADQLKTAISMGDLYFNGAQINPTSLENWKNQGLLSESQYKDILNEYQFANASIYAQKIDDATSKIAEAINSGNRTGLKNLITELDSAMETVTTAYNNKEISKSQYDEIKSDYDNFVAEAKIAPSNVKIAKAVYTNGNEVNPSGNRILRNVIVTVDGTSYEVELANAGSGTSKLATELENKGLFENGQVMLHNGNIYMRVNNPDGSIFTISKLQKAEKKSAKGDYDKLKKALTPK